MDRKLFTPRNSFAVCSAQNKIYIWGGNEIVGQGQKALSDLIEFDTGKTDIMKKNTNF